MTEHTKIPLPGDQPTPAAKSNDGASLIERVVRNFDLVQLSSPPIPENLVPPAATRKRYRRAGDEIQDAVVAPVEEAAPAPAVPPPSETIRPEIVEPEVLPSQPRESVKTTALATLPEPVVFTGAPQPVDRKHLRDQGMIVPEGMVTGLLEEFRIVKRQLLMNAGQLAQQGMGAEAQRILICSPHSGEGKTFTSVNLALAIAAEKETEVLLVDADFAKPSVLSTLGLPGGPGLMDALSNPDFDVVDGVIGTDIPGLWVLPAGQATTSDSEYLSSSRTRQVLDRLTQGAPQRLVIFDSPPALAASPAAELAKYVGQAVLVARADRTGQGALEDAIGLLSGCPNIQLLLNAVHFSPSGRRFGSYYGYGG